jgi:hypothetical protein
MEVPTRADKEIPRPWRYIVDGGRGVHLVHMGRPPLTLCGVRLTDDIFADLWTEDGLAMGHITLTGFDATCDQCRAAIGFAPRPPEASNEG